MLPQPGRSWFDTAPLSAAELVVTLAVSSVVFVAVELEKLVRKRGAAAP